MLKKILISAVTLTATCGALPAFAASSDFYGVVSIGRSALDNNPGSINTFNTTRGFTTSSTVTDDGATAGKVQLGYNLGKTFALEAGYYYMGKVDFVSTTDLGVIQGNKEAQLVNLDLVAKMPLNEKWAIVARFGGYYWQTESAMPNAVPVGTTSIDDDGFDFKIGAGFQYDFNPRWAVRAEYERFNGIGKNTSSGDSKVNLITVGAVLKF